MAQAIVLQNITSLRELMQMVEDLQDPNYLAANGILLEEAPDMIEELRNELAKYSDEVQGYIEWVLMKRMDKQILSNGIADQIKNLQERKQKEDRAIENDDKRLDFVCRSAGITGLKTPVGEISYSGGEKMKVVDESVLPEELKTRSFTIVPVSWIEADRYREQWYTENVKIASLPEIKKRYKELTPEIQETLKYKVYIDNSKTLSVK